VVPAEDDDPKICTDDDSDDDPIDLRTLGASTYTERDFSK
jgi:hypothetical protein